MEDKSLLTVKEVAKQLGVHVNTVRTMAEDGRLKGVKTKGERGHWRFHMKDVEIFTNSDSHMDNESILNEIVYLLDDIPHPLIQQEGISNQGLWEFVQRYYGIRSVFGSIAVHAEMEQYWDIINRKGFIWLGEGSANLMEVLNHNSNESVARRDKLFSLDTKFAFGVVKHPSIFGEDSYSLVPLLVVTDRKDQMWIVDGTLQQFYPNLQKGLAILPMEKARQLYIGLEVYNKKAFAELYSDPYISEKFIQKAKELEKETSTSSL